MRAPRIAVIAMIALAAATSLARPVRAQGDRDVQLETLLARAAAYVTRFIDRFSDVVTEERFEQRWDGLGGRHQTRITRSDLIFVKSAAALDWSELRDVFEVDGRPVRAREDRLLKLFADPKAAGPQVRRILEESARYNIGPIERTTNTPVFPLVVLMGEAQHRFVFSFGESDDAFGPNVRTVAFREKASPTLVFGDKGEDRYSTGRFWLEVDSGRVLQSEMNIEVLRNTWTLTTRFSPDEASGVAMPVEMRERVLFDYQSVMGLATYGRFRRFAVSTGETVRQK